MTMTMMEAEPEVVGWASVVTIWWRTVWKGRACVVGGGGVCARVVA